MFLLKRQALRGNQADGDSDGDGASDKDEGTSDGDGDGIPNYLDYDRGDEDHDDEDGLRWYTVCGIPMDDAWKEEAQLVLILAAVVWLGVKRLGDWCMPADALAKGGGKADPELVALARTKAAKKMLGKAKLG